MPAVAAWHGPARGRGILAHGPSRGERWAKVSLEGDSARCWERLSADLDYPLHIVTLRDDEGRPAGCLVGFASQVSIAPVRFLVAVSRANHSYRPAMTAPAVALHMVARTERSLAALFGGLSGDEIDKFSRCRWSPGPWDLPLLAACPALVAGPVRSRHDLGDHVGLLVDIEHCRHAAIGRQLSFQDMRALEPGHPPTGRH